MKLASLKHGRDGRLVLVSNDLAWFTDAFLIAPTLQAALDDWDRVEPDLRALATAAPPDEPGSEAISLVPYGDPLEGVRLGASGSHIGSGGAMTKVDAARLAADAGVRVTVTATPLLERLVAGERLGTEFEPNPEPEA